MPTENEECDFLSDAKIEELERKAYKEEMSEDTMNTPISLKKSVLNIGQLYPILKDADGKVIDGFHRLEVNPDWKSITLENVKTEEERLIVSAHANIGRRNVTRKERMDVINRLAEIYYAQGLRADAKIMGIGRGGKPQRRNYNEIKHKIAEAMNGVMSPTQIRYYLDSKYLYQAVAEGNKRYHEKRKKDTPAYELLLSSHGKQLRGVYGSDFFDRLEREMMNKAINVLRKDEVFLRGIRREFKSEMLKSIREQVEREITLELSLIMRASILMDYGLVDEIPDWANKEKIKEDVAQLKRMREENKGKLVKAYA